MTSAFFAWMISPPFFAEMKWQKVFSNYQKLRCRFAIGTLPLLLNYQIGLDLQMKLMILKLLIFCPWNNRTTFNVFRV
jgi:hypothetical protein